MATGVAAKLEEAALGLELGQAQAQLRSKTERIMELKVGAGVGPGGHGERWHRDMLVGVGHRLGCGSGVGQAVRQVNRWGGRCDMLDLR